MSQQIVTLMRVPTSLIMRLYHSKREKAPAEIQALMNASGSDEEKISKDAAQLVGEKRTSEEEQDKAANKLESASDVFMFRNVSYDVPTKKGLTTLLNNVNGYVAPGKLTALMGESGRWSFFYVLKRAAKC